MLEIGPHERISNPITKNYTKCHTPATISLQPKTYHEITYNDLLKKEIKNTLTNNDIKAFVDTLDESLLGICYGCIKYKDINTDYYTLKEITDIIHSLNKKLDFDTEKLWSSPNVINFKKQLASTFHLHGYLTNPAALGDICENYLSVLNNISNSDMRELFITYLFSNPAIYE